MKVKPSSYSLVAVMVICLLFIGLSLPMEYLTSKLLPLIFGSVGFLLAAIELGKDLTAKGKPASEVPTGDEADAMAEVKVGVSSYLGAVAWIVGFFLGILLLGFVIAIPLFIFSYMVTRGTRWFVALIFAVTTPALIYLVIDAVPGADLYQGLAFRWLGY
ncbi:tripartite tricarboxylate transporter TctB family protein [Chloroflexota bacterium]